MIRDLSFQEPVKTKKGSADQNDYGIGLEIGSSAVRDADNEESL